MDLVSVEWLLDHLGDPDLRLADVRWYLAQPGEGAAAYARGHLPGGRRPSTVSRSGGPVAIPPDPAAFAALGAGVGSEHLVVAYDGEAIAARLWWMLEDIRRDRSRFRWRHHCLSPAMVP
jgi:thiosulfate/3-mercaptopyruvate sulfurtransferase